VQNNYNELIPMILNRLKRTALLACFLPLTALAQPSQEQQKTEFIQQHFNQETDHASMWQNGWFGLFAGVASLQGIAYTQTENEPNLTDRAVGFTTSFLGAADLLLNPLKTHKYAEQLAAMPDSTPEQQAAKLKQAEQWLAAIAEREAYEQSWVNHVLSGLVNGIAGAVVANEGNRTADGLFTFLSGTLVSELKIYTAPQNTGSVLAQYRNGNYSLAAKTEQPRWQFAATGPVFHAAYRF
jgi:surface antigen